MKRIILFLLLAQTAFAVTNINDCTNFTTSDTFELQNDILVANASIDCMIFKAGSQNSTLDGNGYTIRYNWTFGSSSYTFNNGGDGNNVTITNFTVIDAPAITTSMTNSIFTNNTFKLENFSNGIIELYAASSSNTFYNNKFLNYSGSIFNGMPGSTGPKLNITKTLGTNAIGGTYLGGNYYDWKGFYDTNKDGFSENIYNDSALYTVIDYLPLANNTGGYFISPTPTASLVSSPSLELAFNYTINNMTSCAFEIRTLPLMADPITGMPVYTPTNYTGTMDATNTTCYLNFTETIYTPYTFKGWANDSNLYYPTNETKSICYMDCFPPSGGGGPTSPPEAPPSGGGGTTLVSPSTIAQTVIEASNGNIETLPVNCTPFFSTKFRFIGATQADKVACEFKGLGGLYVKRVGSFVNFAMIFLGFFIYSAYSIENKKSTSFYVFGALSVITLVLTYDLIAFSATAAILTLSGSRLT